MLSISFGHQRAIAAPHLGLAIELELSGHDGDLRMS